MSKIRPKHRPESDAARAAVDAVVSRADQRQQERDAHAAKQAEDAERGSIFGRWTGFSALLVVFAGVTVWNAYTLDPPFLPVGEGILEATARMNLAIIAQEIELYVEDNGAVPESLDDFGYEDENVTLTRSGDGYRLVSHEVDPPIVYTGGTDPSLLLASSKGGA